MIAESLLNDGSAFVLFVILQEFARGEEHSHGITAGDVVVSAIQLALGGVAWGCICGFFSVCPLFISSSPYSCLGVVA